MFRIFCTAKANSISAFSAGVRISILRYIHSCWLKSSEMEETEPFHNFRASKSGDWRILRSSRTSYDRFRSSKIVKKSVGKKQTEKKVQKNPQKMWQEVQTLFFFCFRSLPPTNNKYILAQTSRQLGKTLRYKTLLRAFVHFRIKLQ